MRRTGRARRQTARAAACDPDDIGDSVDTGGSGGSGRDTPKSLREKNREAQRRFRLRQKVRWSRGSDAEGFRV